jgi:hypothetical protein
LSSEKGIRHAEKHSLTGKEIRVGVRSSIKIQIRLALTLLQNPHHALKDRSNIQTENSPAPSPLAGQHPTPPLWLILTNISFASITTLREAIDLSEATMPTPQFSLSWLASYKVAGRRVAAVAAVVEGAREERLVETML